MDGRDNDGRIVSSSYKLSNVGLWAADAYIHIQYNTSTEFICFFDSNDILQKYNSGYTVCTALLVVC